MADAATLAAAITALTNAIALIQAPARSAPVFDPFIEDQLFNLASRAGDQAYTSISAALKDEDVWDGNVTTFPSFVVALRLAQKKESGMQRIRTAFLPSMVITSSHTIIQSQMYRSKR